MGEVLNFPKAKRPTPAAHEAAGPPDLRALATESRMLLGIDAWMKVLNPGTATEDGGDEPDAT